MPILSWSAFVLGSIATEITGVGKLILSKIIGDFSSQRVSPVVVSFKVSSEREFILKKAIAPVQEQYDYIIIDTPPALNLLTANAYAVSDFLIIPMVADILSLVGLSQLWETVESVRSLFNSELKVLGILLTRYNRRTLLSRDVDELAAQLADQMGTVVFKSKIRPGVAIAEAPAHGESIFTYNPRSGAVQDYLEFIDEIAETIHLKGGTEHGEENE